MMRDENEMKSYEYTNCRIFLLTERKEYICGTSGIAQRDTYLESGQRLKSGKYCVMVEMDWKDECV